MLARTNYPQNAIVGREMDSLFEDFLKGFPFAEPLGGANQGVFPALNVWEEDNSFGLAVELPGMKMEDIEITVAGKELTIKGERKVAQQENVKFHRQEWSAGSFSRFLRFPVDLDSEKAEARLENGILTLRLPKHEAVRPRKIQLKATNGQ